MTGSLWTCHWPTGGVKCDKCPLGLLDLPRLPDVHRNVVEGDGSSSLLWPDMVPRVNMMNRKDSWLDLHLYSGGDTVSRLLFDDAVHPRASMYSLTSMCPLASTLASTHSDGGALCRHSPVHSPRWHLLDRQR